MKKVSHLEVNYDHTCIECKRPLKVNILKRKKTAVNRCYACYMLFSGIREVRHFKTVAAVKVLRKVTNFANKQKQLKVMYS